MDDDREGLDKEARRVLRGGSFLNNPRYARGAYRGRVNPGSWDLNIGFRVVVSPSVSEL